MAEHILYPSGGVDFSAATPPAPVVSSWDAPPIVRRSLQTRRRDPQINQNVFVPTVAAPAVVAAWDEVQHHSRGYSAKIRTIHIAAAVGTDSSEFSWERLVGWDSSADVYRAAGSGPPAGALASWQAAWQDIVVTQPQFDYLADQVEEHGGRILRSMVARAERIRQLGSGGRSDEIVGGSSIWPRMWHLWRRR